MHGIDSLWTDLNGLIVSDTGFAFFLGFLAGYVVKAIRI
jgi:uncharacterized membrane protein (Fun14 family)